MLNVAGDDVTDVRAISELIGGILGIEPMFEARDAAVADVVGDNSALHAFLGRGEARAACETAFERMVESGRW